MQEKRTKFIMKLRVDTDKDVNGASTIQTHISRFEAPYRLNSVKTQLQLTLKKHTYIHTTSQPVPRARARA